jgi:predicted alpha/beta superfamily hydrolase
VKPAFSFPSPETGTDYRIYVSPPAAAEGSGSWPLVLFMDGDDQFAAGVAAYRELRPSGAVSPLLLVGVGYGASYAKPENRRGRDYTPVAHGDEPTSGGADSFLQFLTATLWPELVRRYPVDENIRGIAGHSLGSLLVLHALFQKQPFFTHHLASAPSIWWADRALLGAVENFRAAQVALPAKLFLSVGEKDSASMTGDLALLEAQLAEKPFAGLDVVSRRFPNKNHFNVLPDAFGAGLGALFGSKEKINRRRSGELQTAGCG